MKTRTILSLLLAGGSRPQPALGRRRPPPERRSCPTSTRSGSSSRSQDGLPNDHIFAVKVDGPRVWVGTEDGLALHRQEDRQGREDLAGEGRPALPGRHGDRRGPEDRRRLARPVRRRPRAALGRPLRPLAPAQQRPRQRRRLRRRHRERQRLGGHHRRRLALQHEDRRVDGLHREERADGGDLELRRQLRRQGLRLPRRLGQRRARVRHPDRPLEGVPRSRRRDGDRPLPRRRHQPRHRHRREPGRRRPLDLHATSAAPATTAATGAATPSRRAACPPTSSTTSRAAARRRPCSAPTRASAIVDRRAERRRHLGRLHARPRERARPGEGDRRRQGHRERRHAGGRAAQLHDRGRRRRQRHLGRHGEGPRLGDRRGLLPRHEGAAALRVRRSRPRKRRSRREGRLGEARHGVGDGRAGGRHAAHVFASSSALRPGARRSGRELGRQGPEGPGRPAAGLHPVRRPEARRAAEEDRRGGRLHGPGPQPQEGRELRRDGGGPRALRGHEALQGELPPPDRSTTAPAATSRSRSTSTP